MKDELGHVELLDVDDQLQRDDKDTAIDAIRRSLKEFDEGRGRPAREVLEEIRRKHKLPPAEER